VDDGYGKGGLDPVEVFKKNFIKPGEGYFWRDGVWYTSSGKDYANAIEKGAEVFGWNNKWKGWLKPSKVNGSARTGVGVGVHGNADAGEDVVEAQVRLSGDAVCFALQCHRKRHGQRSSLCKMVAEVLNVPVDRVSLTDPDTMINPFNFGLVGSAARMP